MSSRPTQIMEELPQILHVAAHNIIVSVIGEREWTSTPLESGARRGWVWGRPRGVDNS